jgi:hypothetical protein
MLKMMMREFAGRPCFKEGKRGEANVFSRSLRGIWTVPKRRDKRKTSRGRE